MPIRLLLIVPLLLCGLSAATPAVAATKDQQAGLARYGEALRQAIQAQWLRPATLPAGSSCRVHIRQLPGGEVLSAEVMPDCGFDAAGQRSLEAAVLRAQPLPYGGHEDVFQRDLNLRFVAD